MTSPISAISGFAGVPAVSGVTGADGVSGLDTLASQDAVTGPNENFAGMLAKGLESVQATQKNADDLAVKVADGTLQDPAQYTMAANEASLAMQLTLAIRNKALESFQEIMRMQA